MKTILKKIIYIFVIFLITACSKESVIEGFVAGEISTIDLNQTLTITSLQTYNQKLVNFKIDENTIQFSLNITHTLSTNTSGIFTASIFPSSSNGTFCLLTPQNNTTGILPNYDAGAAITDAETYYYYQTGNLSKAVYTNLDYFNPVFATANYYFDNYPISLRFNQLKYYKFNFITTTGTEYKGWLSADIDKNRLSVYKIAYLKIGDISTGEE